jgi:hypothetical protein
MRNLLLILIAFLAVVTFIRAFDRSENDSLKDISRQAAVEAPLP